MLISYFRPMQFENNTVPEFQHTLASPISISGVGIHSGQVVEIFLKPSEPNKGIVFQRTDLKGNPTSARSPITSNNLCRAASLGNRRSRLFNIPPSATFTFSF